ncbi:DNA primase [Vulgatibacter incomptus]|uniref:DNA primase n=1 Tax=Vulgatibacter incomptus TaxID=1391653 RepID=A0A0K1P961_9BACT|nr:DNA primase [Vulgatibacter incomptus]AKU89956.1 DNA primase [Vulgatibacter incomptus]
MLIGKDKIREIVERTDIVQLIGRHVQLKRAGRSFKGLCPFHGERTPSFYVTPERHSYKCFGCQKGGDPIRFLMEYEGKDFMAAVRELAQDAGVEIVFDPEEDRRLAERREMLRACQVAARFFEETLWSPRGTPGRNHLSGRGVSEGTARAAGLGYAPAAFHELRDRLQRENVSLERAVAAGLLALRDRADANDAGRAYDVFRGRLMVPIRDPEGRVIAFGGRVVEGEDDRKYINSRETPLYVKSRVLYGLDGARDSIRRSHEAVLVEGYFDAIALWEAGIPNAVALCSTALTPEHLGLLKRLEVSELKLLLDGDDAGRKAAFRLAGPILASGMSARVLELPEGDDPDTFLNRHGKRGYEDRLAKAPPLSAFVIDGALAGGSEGYEDKLRALGALRPVVAALPEDASRSLFLSEIAGRLKIAPSDVAGFFRRDKPSAEMAAPVQAPVAPPSAPMPRGPSALRGGLPAGRRELELVASLLAFPALVPEFARAVAAGLSDGSLREVVGLLVTGELSGEEVFPRLDKLLAEALRTRAREALRAPDKDWRKELEDGLIHLELERLQEERRAGIAERERLEAGAQHARDPAEQAELAAAVEECSRQIGLIRVEMERLREKLRSQP